MGVLALAGCATQPTVAPADLGALETRARTEAELGNLGNAARAYRELADRSRGQARSDYLITGARLLLERSDMEQASLWLNEATSSATEEQQKLITALLGRVAVASGDPQGALGMLDEIRAPVSVAVSSEIARTRGLALFAVGRYRDAVTTFVEREIWLTDGDEILANQRLIWDNLGASTVAFERLPPSGDSIVDGWLALAPLARIVDDDAEFRRGLLEWRRSYIDHPAAGGLLADLLSDQRAAGRPRQIALLLPLSTPQRTQALAVQDGFLAAHLASGHRSESQIRVYDTGRQGATDAYLNAQLDGADFIVGPLLRQEVEEVMPQSGFVPTLALNFAQLDTPFLRSFYQFAQAPEDEARAIARHAIAAGHRTAIAIHESNDRGYRLLASFRNEFESLGGRLLDSAGYVRETVDFSAPIRSLLNISLSEQRHRRLQANLGKPIGFEPRRRQDVDMIFLQADPRLGRLLVPQLKYHEAGDIPTYATSEVYDPGDQTNDSDLDGVMFPDLPMLLEPDTASTSLTAELQTFWPQRARQLARYYGFGFDAYHLIGALYLPQPSDWPVAGMSGQLNVDEQGRIHRILPFGQFRRGRPVVLESLPAPSYLEPEFLGRR